MQGEMEYKGISYVPALYKVFDEILVNAADNLQRDPKMKVLFASVVLPMKLKCFGGKSFRDMKLDPFTIIQVIKVDIDKAKGWPC